jgi:hypothetical protein
MMQMRSPSTDKKRPRPGDPRLEFARLIGRQEQPRLRKNPQPLAPPPAVDDGFCYDEESSS